jgi:hypothetical protein
VQTLISRLPEVDRDVALHVITALLQTPISERAEKFQQLATSANLPVVWDDKPHSLMHVNAAPAALLVAAGVSGSGVAAEVFAGAAFAPWTPQLVAAAKRLAAGLADAGSGMSDTVLEPFRIAGWAMGERPPARNGAGFPVPCPHSAFWDAADRDARNCPLRAGEIAAEIAAAVAMFHACCDGDD